MKCLTMATEQYQERFLTAKYEDCWLYDEGLLSEQVHMTRRYNSDRSCLALLREVRRSFRWHAREFGMGVTKVELDLNEGAVHHIMLEAYPIPKIHMETLKMEVDRLCDR